MANIDPLRFWRWFDQLAAIGRTDTGWDRLAWSPLEAAAREWFEQAAQAPAPSAEAASSLFYELAEALESLGEVERALAIYLELQTDAGDYRDVSARISRLANAQARG